MRGTGGPLLCIGDLPNDVGADVVVADSRLHRHESHPSSPSVSALDDTSPTSDLTKLFQESYEHLNEALAGTDHSWTALTLKLVQSTNSNVTLSLDKTGELQKIGQERGFRCSSGKGCPCYSGKIGDTSNPYLTARQGQ